MKTSDFTNLTTNQSELLNFENFKLGKEDGFTFFYTNYFPSLAKAGLRYLDNYLVVEELLNDAFLYTWKLKHLIECPRHLYCFTRLRLKWACLRYRQQQKLERRCCYHIQHQWENDAYLDLTQETNEELEALVYKAIPLLPPTRQNILKLYFNYGLSHKQIAARYCTSNQQIARQLQESILFLKSVINKKKQRSNTTAKVIKMTNLSQSVTNTEDLRKQVFELRYNNQYSFAQIATALGIDENTAREHYVTVHRTRQVANY
ncbi:sigma-70 family RNA polymerase sigma factor [Niabella sp. CJ426]|uniref:sigma-70 family RNA polymerase sigma factor n=1 Tax=Niabella sp. CJ426 TaxID=3393740 RepID=UPI003D03A341